MIALPAYFLPCLETVSYAQISTPFGSDDAACSFFDLAIQICTFTHFRIEADTIFQPRIAAAAFIASGNSAIAGSGRHFALKLAGQRQFGIDVALFLLPAYRKADAPDQRVKGVIVYFSAVFIVQDHSIIAAADTAVGQLGLRFDVEIIFQVLTLAIFRSDAETVAAVVRAITVASFDRSKVAVDAAVLDDQVGKMPFIAHIAAINAKQRRIDIAVSMIAADITIQM